MKIYVAQVYIEIYMKDSVRVKLFGFVEEKSFIELLKSLLRLCFEFKSLHMR